MDYILLAAGMGTRLHPLTLDCPKSMHIIDEERGETIIQRIVRQIILFDPEACINIVVGFNHQSFYDLKFTGKINFIYNPFYKVTNSIASLWFVRDILLNTSNVTIINSDIVMPDKLFSEVVTKSTEFPTVLYDSRVRYDGDYNVDIESEFVTVMSKELKSYEGEYAGVTKLDHEGSIKLYDEINNMVDLGQYDRWYEDALVKLIFKYGFKLKAMDVSYYSWVEVDDVNDMAQAKRIVRDDRV